MRSSPLIAGSFGMRERNVADDDDMDRLGGIAEVSSNGLLDVLMKLIKSGSLGEDIVAESAGAPILTVEIGLNLYQHAD